MNADARALGLSHTHYTTPIGLDTPGNYSSPDDLVRLADYLMRQLAVLRQDRGAPVGHADQRPLRSVTSSTPTTCVGKVPWIDGVKTGHTAAAGYVLVSEGTRDGFTLLASVLGTTSEYERDSSALKLARVGFRRVPGGRGRCAPASALRGGEFRTRSRRR